MKYVPTLEKNQIISLIQFEKIYNKICYNTHLLRMVEMELKNSYRN